MLGKIWPEEVCKKFHEIEHDLYSSGIIRKIKSRKIKWTGNLACNGYVRSSYTVLVGSSNGRDCLKLRDVAVKTVLKLILR
jgi:hypothetical protein